MRWGKSTESHRSPPTSWAWIMAPLSMSTVFSGVIDQIGLAFVTANFGGGIIPIFELLTAELFARPFPIKVPHRLVILWINSGRFGELLYISPISLVGAA